VGAAGAAAVTTERLWAGVAPAERTGPGPDGPGRRACALASLDDMAADPRPRVLFVEDERSITEPFSRALAREGFEPIVAHTAAEALARFAEAEPDVVLLDISLPDGDGRDICRELRGRSDVPIIMLTARGTETDRIVGLELGADDYVVKPFSGGEVIARLRAILRRARRPTAGGAPEAARPAPVTIGPLTVDPGSRRATLDAADLTLSRKEFDLLAELVAHAGTVVSREDLMSRVWDENWFGSTKTLDVHIRWLRQKLDDDPSAPRFIHTVRGVGFRFTAPDEWAP
jgi:two-component system response regulator RegX3